MLAGGQVQPEYAAMPWNGGTRIIRAGRDLVEQDAGLDFLGLAKFGQSRQDDRPSQRGKLDGRRSDGQIPALIGPLVELQADPDQQHRQ